MWGGDHDKRPHVLATRYAALAASLLLLNANYQVPSDLIRTAECAILQQLPSPACCNPKSI